MFRFLVLLLALVAGLMYAQQPASSGDKKPQPEPKPLKSAPLPKDLSDELNILNLAAENLKQKFDASMLPLNAKFDSLRSKACEVTKIPDCALAQGPNGGVMVQEKNKPPVDLPPQPLPAIPDRKAPKQ